MSDGVKVAAGYAVAIGLFIWGCVALARAEQENEAEWQAWSARHRCHLTRVIDETTATGTGISSKGSVVVTSTVIPEKRCWSCDDGVERCRSYGDEVKP